MERKHIILSLIDKEGLGLEVGPSHDPVAAKAAGYDVRVIDHLSQDELKAKYAGHGVNTDRIEPVDFIWRGEALEDVAGIGRGYDWIIASHVIEHLPDPIGFMKSCQKILKPGGVLSLAIPDKRYCLDHLRPPSTPGDVLQAHLEARRRHLPGQVFDSFSLASQMDGSMSWNADSRGAIDLLHGHGFGGLMLQNYLKAPDYVDIHAWVFTPSSFRLVVSDIIALGYLNIREAAFTETLGCEFFVAYLNAPAITPPDRLELAKRARAEAFQDPPSKFQSMMARLSRALTHAPKRR
jgi:SAM-dependent methyltransferase